METKMADLCLPLLLFDKRGYFYLFVSHCKSKVKKAALVELTKANLVIV